MSNESVGECPFKKAPPRWSWRRKVFAAALLLFVTAAGTVAWKLGPYIYWRYSAQKRVAAEIARLGTAGEPLTAAELHAQYKVPKGTPDLTTEWSKALAELHHVIPTVKDPEFQHLPLILSDRSLDDLEPTAASSCLVPTESFLVRIEPQVQTVLKVASKPGEVRFPVKFEDSIAALLDDAQHARHVGRVLAIRARVSRIRQNRNESEKSISALFALVHTLDHSRTNIEQLVRCSLTRVVCEELCDAANHNVLSSEQLSGLCKRLDSLDFKRPAWNCYSGERVMGWQAMDLNASIVADDPGGLTTLIRSAGPVDRAFFLELSARAVNASQLEYTAAADEFDSINQEIRQLSSLPPLERTHYLYSAMLIGPMTAVHFGFTSAAARCKATRAALLAREFRRGNGRWPTNLSELREAGLAPDCVDPFTNDDLILREEGATLAVYSVGENLIDDGGREENNRSRPDIVISVHMNP